MLRKIEKIYHKWHYYPPDPKFTAYGTTLPFAVKNKIYRKWHYYSPSLRPIGGGGDLTHYQSTFHKFLMLFRKNQVLDYFFQKLELWKMWKRGGYDRSDGWGNSAICGKIENLSQMAL